MKKRLFAGFLLMAFLLSGCQQGTKPVVQETVPATTIAQETVATEPLYKSYTGEVNDAVIASVGEAELTNRELQAWYWAEVAQYRQEQHETAPDFEIPLDRQACELDSEAETWQEYFLWEAIDTWHTAQALVMQSKEVPMPLEDVYRPSENYHETYLSGMPATKYLYGYNKYYQLNSMHDAYLNDLPNMLKKLATDNGYASVSELAEKAFGTTEEILNTYVSVYNQGYMYFVGMSYYLEIQEEEAEQASEEAGVNIRHILLIPEQTEEELVTVADDGTVACSENAWAACEAEATELLDNLQWDFRTPEYVFAELAVKHSRDVGTALDGGAYHHLHQGQLLDVLDQWCFEASRQPGDVTVLRSDYGVHILYYVSADSCETVDAENEAKQLTMMDFIRAAKDVYPVTMDMNGIVLSEAKAVVASGDILYPDIAHERYPEVPLYLQQDYPGVPYNIYTLAGFGCGITSMAMLSSYMTDEEWTPPELSARFGKYGSNGGTDTTLFSNEPSGMGFYLHERTYDWQVAKAALEAGNIVVSLQYAGYWTRAGHYLVLENIDKNDMVQVRDSNIFNYIKLSGHKVDKHEWETLLGSGQAFWIYAPKITSIPACWRCGTDEAITEALLTEDYTCHKCQTALLRRNAYLEN